MLGLSTLYAPVCVAGARLLHLCSLVVLEEFANSIFGSDLILDYVFGNRKFGGNAQSITKNRWIHHTSFLWDYEVRNMAYLKLPKRAPEYRLVKLLTCLILSVFSTPNFFFFDFFGVWSFQD